MSSNLGLVIALIVLLIIYKFSCSEGFNGKPSEEEINKYTKQLITNKPLIETGLSESKSKMPWLDAITYEDARGLIRRDSFTEPNVKNLFR
jgi:hypothetical protein